MGYCKIITASRDYMVRVTHENITSGIQIQQALLYKHYRCLKHLVTTHIHRNAKNKYNLMLPS